MANAQAGNSNGGPCKYGLDRVLVDSSGKIVRKLCDGEIVHMSGHSVRYVPCDDEDKLAAIRHMFKRFAEADIGYRELARELDTKGFPSPGGNGWRHAASRLKEADPNTLQEVFQEAVSRIECRWEMAQKTNRVGTRLIGGKVHLKNWNPTRCLSSSWIRRSIAIP